MISAASALTTVIHDHWSDCERVLIQNTQLDNTLRHQLKYLAQTLHDSLVAALSLEQLFGEQNDKTMYIAPFIRSVIHAAVTGVEIQHVSTYPVAVNPCFVNDPLLGLLPRHGYATDIVCANILAPATFEEDDSEGTDSDGSSSDDVDMQDDDYEMESIHEEVVAAESDRTTRRWLAGEYITRKPEVLGASTGFYQNQESSSQDQSVLAYSVLARLTLDASDESTPLALMCVSKPQDLHVAMASCLYQRSTWGIREPLMGIALDNRTCFVQVLFAWLESSDDSDSSIVHLSRDTEGFYDLSDASDAAVFASYVASMSQRFPVICEKAKAFTPRLEEDIADRRLLVWRVDQRRLAAEIEDGVSWDEGITLWRDSVNSFVPVTFWDDIKEQPSRFLSPTSTMPTTRSSSRNRTAPSEQHTTSSSTEMSIAKKTKTAGTSKRGRSRSATRSENASDNMEGSSDKNMKSTRGRSQSTTRSSDTSNASMEITKKKATSSRPSSVQGTQIVHTYAEETTDVSRMKNPPPVAGSKSRPATTIFISASVLAAGGKYEDKTILMSYWMVARNVIPRTLMFPLMLLDERYKMNDIFRTINAEYYELVSFSWINKLGVLGKNMRSLPLVKLAQATADRMQSPPHTGQWMPYKALSPSCEKILCDNLWEIASVLEDVQRINANSKTQASELECRHNLDRLMMRSFHGHSDGSTEKISQKEYSNTAHVMVSLERSLMLPTGSLVDAYTKCDDITDQVDLMVSVNARTDAITIADSRNISKFAKALSPETSNVVPHARNTPDPTSMSGHHSDRTLRTFSEDVEAVQKSAQAALERNNIGRLGVIHVAKGKENPMLQPYNEEPLKAVCDSVGYIRIPEVFTSIPASSSFNIIQPRHASPLPSKSVAQQSTPSDLGASKGTSLARRQQMGRDFEMDNLDDLFAISQSFSVSMDPSRRKEPIPFPVEQASKHSLNISVLTGGESEDIDDLERITELDVRRDLFLPIISSEHKKVLGVFFATNVNQGRMYATASVKFYVALGIYNIGVYTIISEGSVLVVTVSYAEKPDDEDGVPIVHILERNAISFDISEPLGILNFATFLIKLRVEYVPKVLKRVYSVIGDSPVEIRKYLQTLNIPTGGDKNQAAWRKHKP